MNEQDFNQIQKKFAQRLVRLIQIPAPYKGGNFDLDKMAGVIEQLSDGTEDFRGLIVTHLPVSDRRLRERMVALNHPLADCPSPVLWGDTFASDEIRVKRYELLSILMVRSGFPRELLDDGVRFAKWRFAPMSSFFKAQNVRQLNEQFTSCWGRRLLCYYGQIQDVKVPGKELRDNLARGVAGATTEKLLRDELGTTRMSSPTADLSHLLAILQSDGEAVIVEPVKPSHWPEGFFDAIRIDDPAFVRPDQGPTPSAPPLD
jgi:hypothetical protein